MKMYRDDEGSKYQFTDQEDGLLLMTILNKYGQVVSEASIPTTTIDALIKDSKPY